MTSSNTTKQSSQVAQRTLCRRSLQGLLLVSAVFLSSFVGYYCLSLENDHETRWTTILRHVSRNVRIIIMADDEQSERRRLKGKNKNKDKNNKKAKKGNEKEQKQKQAPSSLSYSIFTDAQVEENNQLVQKKRKIYKEKCASKEMKRQDVMKHLDEFYVPPQLSNDDTQKTVFVKNDMEACPFVFLDLGANVGDSLGKLINAGIQDCPSKSIDAPLYDVLYTGRITEVNTTTSTMKRRNKLVEWVTQMMAETSTQVSRDPQNALQPEHYCYYGVEGNPHFTKRLQALEFRIMNTVPRPVRRAHFLTETIAAGQDGPSTLYLDTINAERNFWGSSIYASHQDVHKSAQAQLKLQKQQEEQTGDTKTNKKTQQQRPKPLEASVTAITLTTLLPQIASMKAGSHLIIKCDIEGAEFVLFNEAFQSGILCKYATSAVRVDVLLEVHPQRMFGQRQKTGQKRFHRGVKQELKKCGVNLYVGSDADDV